MKNITTIPAIRIALAKYQGLTAREKIIIIVALIVAVFIALYQIYEPIRGSFQNQQERITALEASMKNAGLSIERYIKLKARRDKIEQEYKGIEFKEGALSHLENLVRTKAGVSSGFTIKDNPPKEFGGNYEQTLFSIKFTTTSLDSLLNFLKELANGPRPLIISKIDVQKSRFAERLDVDIDATSIRRLK